MFSTAQTIIRNIICSPISVLLFRTFWVINEVLYIASLVGAHLGIRVSIKPGTNGLVVSPIMANHEPHV